MKARLLILLWLFGLTVCAVADDDRIWIEATVNDKPARFVFDTESLERYLLYRKSVDRLGLAMRNVPSDKHSSNKQEFDGYVRAYTQICSLRVGVDSVKASFWVLDLPPVLDTPADGLFGWPWITNCVTMIDGKNQIIERYSKVPLNTTDWVKLPVQTNSRYLHLILPGRNGKNNVLAIDTGSPDGVKLNPSRWRQWKSFHKNQPTTLTDVFYYGCGIVVSEVQLAGKIDVGPLVLTDVPVTKANATDVAYGTADFEATLGLAALKRVDLIVDALHNVAYVRPKKETPPPYTHNRAGVVFVPPDLQSSNLIAHVANDSPAYTAGIRDGDLLLERDGRSVQNWRSDRTIEINTPMSDQPAGTKMTFTLKRGKKIFKANVVLKNILSPTP